METYYKVFYREENGLKCTRTGFEEKEEAIRVAESYATRQGITDIEIYEYQTIKTLIKRY